jgi:hypothetical protein
LKQRGEVPKQVDQELSEAKELRPESQEAPGISTYFCDFLSEFYGELR